jgi:hypothetical protein
LVQTSLHSDTSLARFRTCVLHHASNHKTELSLLFILCRTVNLAHILSRSDTMSSFVLHPANKQLEVTPFANVTLSSLPTEILYHIFELTVGTSRTTSLRFRLVSSWAKEIADRNLDAVLITQYRRDAQIFKQILKAKPEDDDSLSPAKSVRKIWLQTSFRDEPEAIWSPPVSWSPVAVAVELCTPMLLGLFHLFPNLEVLAWAPTNDPEQSVDLDVVDVYNSLCMRGASRPGIRPPGLSDVQLTFPYFPHGMEDGCSYSAFGAVTHLRLDSPGEESWNSKEHDANILKLFLAVRDECQYSSLTHLCIGPFARLSIHLSLLRRHHVFKDLEMIVIEVQECFLTSESWRSFVAHLREERVQDNRIFVDVRQSGLREDWECEAFGGMGVWDRARKFTSQIDSEKWEQFSPLLYTTMAISW